MISFTYERVPIDVSISKVWPFINAIVKPVFMCFFYHLYLICIIGQKSENIKVMVENIFCKINRYTNIFEFFYGYELLLLQV